MSGKLFGVGVGPGDPELITLKAIRTIKESDVLAIPVSDKEYAQFVIDKLSNTRQVSDKSVSKDTANLSFDTYRDSCISYQIASQAVKELDQKELLYLPMPMTKDKEFLKACHEYGISLIKERLERNETISFLTLGDPSVYSTYLYIHKRALKLGYEAEIISGVPSFCAVAAKLNMGLVENSEELHVIPASYQIEEALHLKGTKVLMKTGKNLSKVKEILSTHNNVSSHTIRNLTNNLACDNTDENTMNNPSKSSSHTIKVVENCGMKNEKVYESLDEVGDSLSYYSMIVIKED